MSNVQPQVWVNNEQPDPNKVDTIRRSPDTPPKKPEGGMWTSTRRETDAGVVSSAWIEWMKSEHYSTCSDPQAWLLYPKDDIDVYEIDDVYDAKEIMGPDPRYEGMSLTEYRIDWYEVFDKRGYDAIHLTKEGQWRTRFPNKAWIDENGERKWEQRSENLRGYSLYGWDSECYLWKKWCFEGYKYLGGVEIPETDY